MSLLSSFAIFSTLTSGSSFSSPNLGILFSSSLSSESSSLSSSSLGAPKAFPFPFPEEPPRGVRDPPEPNTLFLPNKDGVPNELAAPNPPTLPPNAMAPPTIVPELKAGLGATLAATPKPPESGEADPKGEDLKASSGLIPLAAARAAKGFEPPSAATDAKGEAVVVPNENPPLDAGVTGGGGAGATCLAFPNKDAKLPAGAAEANGDLAEVLAKPLVGGI